MRLVRFHAAQWHIDPHKIGVLGFSAGGYLTAEISTNFERQLYPPVDGADKESARPDFAMPIYPGHLVTADGKLNPNVPVSGKTPPTFLVQAEDDFVDGVKQSLVYYAALARRACRWKCICTHTGDMHLACGPRVSRLPSGRGLLRRGCG